jgi:hypothetical protein
MTIAKKRKNVIVTKSTKSAFCRLVVIRFLTPLLGTFL